MGDPVFRGWSRRCGEPGVDYPQPARGHGRRRRDIKARICYFAEHHTAGQAISEPDHRHQAAADHVVRVPPQLQTVRAGQHLAAKVDLVGDPSLRVDPEELPRAGLRHEEHAALCDDPVEVGTSGLGNTADRQQRRGVHR
ncbi:MAG: hypothetical protein ABWZ30_07155 [Jiangellaceae bacterium]